jgi:hypothetical protein
VQLETQGREAQRSGEKHKEVERSGEKWRELIRIAHNPFSHHELAQLDETSNFIVLKWF